MAKRKKTQRNKRPWPMTLVALLLLIQGAGGIGIGLFQITQVQETVLRNLTAQVIFDTYFIVSVVTIGLIFIAGLCLYAIVGILRRWRSAWSIAMAVEGISLGLSVFLYFNSQTFYNISDLILLAYGVVMVVYLILPGVQAAFLPPVETPHEGRHA